MLQRRPTPFRPDRPVGPIPGPVGFALSIPAGIAAAVLAALVTAPSADRPATSIGVAAVAAALVSRRTTAAGALAAALVCWGFADGFGLHSAGVLAARTADLLALGVVAGAALLARLVGGR